MNILESDERLYPKGTIGGDILELLHLRSMQAHEIAAQLHIHVLYVEGALAVMRGAGRIRREGGLSDWWYFQIHT
jgi:hypothetical protein